jgi:hypothetical protein
MDALVVVHNEEIRLCDAGLLKSATVLAARSSADHSSFAHPTAPVPLVSPSIVPPFAHGESGGLHCDHCSHDGHVDAFCYMKKKAQKVQAHHSSQGTGGTGSRGSEMSSASSETQEILMLLHRLAISMSLGVVGSVTQPSALTGSATASQSSSPSLGTASWYLDSGASFHMTPILLNFLLCILLITIALFISPMVPSFYCWIGHALF